MTMTQTESIVRLVRDVLGTDVVGVYLHGSSVLGGRRFNSDLDVLAVSRQRTTADERRALGNGLLKISARFPPQGPDLPIELTVVAQPDVRPWRYPPRCEFLYGEWLRREFERGVISPPELKADLALGITLALRGNTPLFGPPPSEVLPPVPPEDLRRASVAGVPGLLADLEWDTRNVVLTLARVWTTLETGAIRSKDAAADWALARLPPEHQPVLAHARAVYLGDEEERWDDLLPRVRPHVEYVAAIIRRLGAEP